MTDPYKVLGVAPSVTDEELKHAYRTLAKKYHPDNYIGNPLADLAAQKMQEINEAYDTITTMRKNHTTQNTYTSYQNGQEDAQGTSAGYSTGSNFADVRRLIYAKRLVEADELLNGTPANRRDAEWYFLKGNIFYTRGWLEEAYSYTLRAVQMAPNNLEYQSALRAMNQQRQYASPYVHNGSACCDPCTLCTGLICCNMCCR